MLPSFRSKDQVRSYCRFKFDMSTEAAGDLALITGLSLSTHEKKEQSRDAGAAPVSLPDGVEVYGTTSIVFCGE